MFTVDGKKIDVELDPLEVLHSRLELLGTKKGCDDHGQFGARVVHLDGRRVVSCLTIAVDLTRCAPSLILLPVTDQIPASFTAGIVAALGDPCYRHLISPSPGEDWRKRTSARLGRP